MADTPTGSDSNGGTTTVVSNPPNPPTTNTVPNTTTDTTAVEFQSSTPESATSTSPPISVSYPRGTYLFNSQAQLDAYSKNPDQYATSFVGSGYTVTEITPPPQKQEPVQSSSNTATTVPGPEVTTAAQLNDPLAGLTPAQVQALDGADPTDPYVRARLGIPQLPDSTLTATPGFGFGNLTTNLPTIDSALGTIRSLFSSPTPATTASVTTLSNAQTAAIGSTQPTTVSALVATGQVSSADADALLKQQALAQAETYSLSGPTTGQTTTTLTADQADAFYNGTGTLTAEQRLTQDRQTAAAATALYSGSNNEALRQIDAGNAAIAANEVGIARAEKIIAQNNVDLANPFISDASRAELLANNAAQQEYIQAATENIAINQNIIEQNANVYAAGGGNPGNGQTPTEVSALVDPGVAQAPVDPTTTEGFGVQDPVDPTTLEGYGVSAFNEEDLLVQADAAADVNPLTDEELAAQDAALQEQALNDLVQEQSPEPVDPATDEELAAQDAALQDQILTDMVLEQAPADVDPTTDEELQQRVQDSIAADATTASALASQSQGSQQAAIVAQAKKQATFQARYKQPGNTDWRVRLSLGPGAQYLYNATPAGVLAPLAANGGTDGVIFPYTPSITTTYSANYEQYDLIHSNYRGVFYKSSRVGDIQLRGTFTAQDTTEANYLLAVIHFFRSVTKMFYGQDAERGTPPPVCLLNGFGGYQFSDHPVVVSSFNYSLPNDVDYIRTTNPNNFGLNLNNRYNPSGASLPAGGALAGAYRLLNAVQGGLNKGALPKLLAPNTVVGSVTNNVPASYVPTKMEIDVTLIPVQSRSQVSQQFSLKGFANGDLLKGGFW
jgi:YHS domain-containing protein